MTLHEASSLGDRALTAIEPRILGIDPGITGGLALLHGTDIAVWEIPLLEGEVDPQAVARIVRHAAPDMAVIERASSRPGRGLRASFATVAVTAASSPSSRSRRSPTTW
jgi:hypothetical protein